MTRKRHKSSGPHSQPYQYNELPRDGSFRYLILHRGTGNDPLRCSLQTAPLSKTKFEALSYVWGKSKKNKKIICDGRVIKITKSLSNALRRLRLPHKRRKLWADGICINQNDLEEKGHQVAIMGQIYRSATCVLIYIGPEDDGHGSQVCSLLHDINQMIDETCKQIYGDWDSFPYPEEDDPLLLGSRWKSVNHLLRHDWFERGWVVREAAFAQYGLVIWNQHEFGWEALMRSLTWFTTRGWRMIDNFDVQTRLFCHFDLFEQRNRAFAKLFCPETSWKPQSVLEDLDSARPLQLSDARDRIYAFVELSEGAERLVDIQPDYSLAPLEVYQQFAMRYIWVNKDTRILDYVHHGINFETIETPSWIPRWDNECYSIVVKIPRIPLGLGDRDGSICQSKIIDDGVLSVRGVVIDNVEYVSEMFELESMTPQTIGKLWRTVRHMLETSPYGTHQGLDAFLDTLCAGMYYGRFETWRRSRDAIKAYVQFEHENLVSGKLPQQEYPPSVDGGFPLYLDRVNYFMEGYRFIVTTRGYMGLAPAVAQKDDLCGIVFGCQTPCVLRPTAQEQFYSFLGASFLLGKEVYNSDDGSIFFSDQLGHEDSKDWVEWDVQEQDIYLV